MTSDVQFGLLGPFEFRVRGRLVPLRSARSRILLASLLVQPGRLVSSAELIEAIWSVRQPDNPRRALHVCVVRARAILAAAGAERLIVSGADGYRIDVPPDAIDITLFRRWTEQAGVAAERLDLAGERKALAQALSLWRGEPLAEAVACSWYWTMPTALSKFFRCFRVRRERSSWLPAAATSPR